MKRYLCKWLLVPACFVWAVAFWGCTGRYYLMVDYQVPPSTEQLSGNTVYLRFTDQREDKVVLAQKAAKKFKAFRDRYSLSWITPEKERIISGEHNMSSLFKETFEKRLKVMGAEIAEERTSGLPELTIVLQTFTIDLKDHKWVADVGYQASLTKEGNHPVYKERIKGNAQRVKIIGRKGADIAVSEIFTDAVNRLDIGKLFQKAGYIP